MTGKRQMSFPVFWQEEGSRELQAGQPNLSSQDYYGARAPFWPPLAISRCVKDKSMAGSSCFGFTKGKLCLNWPDCLL